MKIAANILLLVTVLSVPLSAQAFLDKAKQAAVSNYADQMISLMQQPVIGFATDRTLLLKPYLNKSDTSYTNMLALYREIDSLLSGMENYSIAVSTLSTTGASEPAVIDQLATELEKFLGELPTDKIEDKDLDFASRIQLIRQQEKYLDALLIAQPVISAIGRYGQGLISQYEENLGELTARLSDNISAEYAGLVGFKQSIDDRRVKFLARVDTDKPNAPETEKTAIHQLNQLSRIMEVMQPYLKHFWDTQAELNSVSNEIYMNTARLKLSLLIWVRAHAQLASGQTDGDAFDVMEYKRLIQEAAKFGKDLSNR